MKKVKKLESLKGYALSAKVTSKLDGGYLTTGAGSREDGKTWVSDAQYSTAMGDSKDWIGYDFGDIGFTDKDAPIFNNGDNRTDVLPLLSIDLVGVTAIEAQPISDLGSMQFLLS